jgi:hypothetical protein
MIQFCEIINRGTIIRIATKDFDSNQPNEPIEFDVDVEVNTLEELVSTIKNYLDNGSLHGSPSRG